VLVLKERLRKSLIIVSEITNKERESFGGLALQLRGPTCEHTAGGHAMSRDSPGQPGTPEIERNVISGHGK
jgi:hypothetical protein